MNQTDVKKLNTSFLDKKPIGHITFYYGQEVPENYMICHGQILNVVTNPEYDALYKAIGNIYGGTDNTNFRLPTFNLKGNRKINSAIIKYTYFTPKTQCNNNLNLVQNIDLEFSKCECGSEAVNSLSHSDWCPKG